MVASIASRAGAHLRRNAEWYWAPALYLLAVCVLYRIIFSGEVGFGWDSSEFYWPNLKFLGDSLTDGEYPLWNPYNRGGHPVFADPSQAATYPPHWILAPICSATDFGFGVLQFEVLFHHALAGTLLHLYLRSRGLSVSAATIGGAAWIGSSAMLIHKASNILWPIVWLPLIWIAIDFLVSRSLASGRKSGQQASAESRLDALWLAAKRALVSSWRPAAGLAGAIYLAGSAGSPPGFFYVLVAAVLYGGYRVVADSLAHRPSAAALSALLFGLALAAFAAFALLAITVVPTTGLIPFTARTARPVEFALSLPLEIGATLRGMFTPALARPDAYLGMGTLLLASVAITVGYRRDRYAAVFFALASVLFALMAFGPHTPVLRWLASNVPGFRMFRIASRYRLMFAPMFAVLAAYGAQAIIDLVRTWSVRDWDGRKRWLAVATIAIATLAVIVLAKSGDGPPRPSRSPSTMIWMVCVAAAMALAAVIHRRAGAKILLFTIAIGTTFDAAHFQFARGPIMERVPKAEASSVLAELGESTDEWRIYDEFAIGHRVGSREKVRDFRGYPAGDQLQFRRYANVLKLARSKPEILEAFNVRYLLQKRHPRTGVRTSFVPRPPGAHFVRVKPPLFEAAHPVPLIVWLGAAKVVDRGKVLAEMLAAEGENGDRRLAILEPSEASKLSGDGSFLVAAADDPLPSVAGQLVSFERNRIVATIEAPERGLVVLNELQYPGWEVEVDGKPGVPLRVNYLLRGVEVEAGTHQVVWTLRPQGWGGLLAAFFAGQLFFLAAFVSSIRRRRRRRRTGHDHLQQ